MDTITHSQSISFREKWYIILASPVLQSGFGMFIFFAGFFWGVGGIALTRDVLYFQKGTTTVGAHVYDVKSANYTMNKVPMATYFYRFTHDGREQTGKKDAPHGAYRKGASITVDVATTRPALHRLGYGSIFPRIVPVTFLFILLACVLVVLVGIGHGTRSIGVLGNGVLTVGMLSGIKPTNMRVNHRPVYRMLFSYTAHDGRAYRLDVLSSMLMRFVTRRPSARAGVVDSGLAELRTSIERAMTVYTSGAEALPEGERVAKDVIYDTNAPSRARLLLTLPGMPVIGENGRIIFTRMGSMVPLLILPLLAVLSVLLPLHYFV